MKKNLEILLYLFIFILAILTGLSMANAGWMDGVTSFGRKDTGYRTGINKTFYIKDLPDKGVYGDGLQIKNITGNDLFIPTRTEAEWNSFKTNKPSGIFINSVRDGVTQTTITSTACSTYCSKGVKTTTIKKSCKVTPLNGGKPCENSTITKVESCNGRVRCSGSRPKCDEPRSRCCAAKAGTKCGPNCYWSCSGNSCHIAGGSYKDLCPNPY